MVTYCNAACKKKHRSKHKKKCDRRVAELHEEALFKEHPPNEECPICLILMPTNVGQTTFKSCCGKVVCNGCIYAMENSEGKDLCPFCRIPPASSEEEDIQRLKKLMAKGNGDAFDNFGGFYDNGLRVLSQDHQKANELYLQSGELGCARGYYNLGISYDRGRGVEMDAKKAKYYYELAAMNGSIPARNNLGCLEHKTGNIKRAMKHFILAALAGHERSLNNVKIGFRSGVVTKDVYASTLRSYQQIQDGMKSDERDKAAEVYGL